jgi:hypothetical protein
MLASIVAALLGGFARGGGFATARMTTRDETFGIRLAVFGLLLYAYGVAFAVGSLFDWGTR